MLCIRMEITFTIAVIIFYIYPHCAQGQGEEEERYKSPAERLFQTLLDEYDPRVRPARSPREETNLTLGVEPYFIDELDEEKAVFSLHSTLNFVWYDHRLQWNPNEYEKLSVIRVPSERLWLPDIRVYNSPSNEVDPKGSCNALVYSTGKVLWIPPTRLECFCPESASLRSTSDKADRVCQATLGSWTYDGWLVNLTANDVKMKFEHYVDGHSKWELLTSECTLERILEYYSCCPEPYVTINATFPLRRKRIMDNHTWQSAMVFPCAIAAFLALWASFSRDSCAKIRTAAMLLSFLAALLVFVCAEMKLPPRSSNAGLLIIWTTVIVLSNFLVNAVVKCLCLRPVVLHSNFVTKLMSCTIKGIPVITSEKRAAEVTAEDAEDKGCCIVETAITGIVATLHAIAFIIVFFVFT